MQYIQDLMPWMLVGVGSVHARPASSSTRLSLWKYSGRSYAIVCPNTAKGSLRVKIADVLRRRPESYPIMSASQYGTRATVPEQHTKLHYSTFEQHKDLVVLVGRDVYVFITNICCCFHFTFAMFNKLGRKPRNRTINLAEDHGTQ